MAAALQPPEATEFITAEEYGAMPSLDSLPPFSPAAAAVLAGAQSTVSFLSHCS
jgi:hypothetical protein